MGEPPSDRLELVAFEQALEPGVSDQDDGEDESGVEVEVGEDAEGGEDLGSHVLGLVEEQDGSQPLVVELVGEALLELAQEAGIGAGGRQAAGGGDLAAHVSLGEVGDLDVVDSETGLGEAFFEGSEEQGLAAAGGGDQGGGHAVLDDAA